jgi:hypothetical protein
MDQRISPSVDLDRGEKKELIFFCNGAPPSSFAPTGPAFAAKNVLFFGMGADIALKLKASRARVDCSKFKRIIHTLKRGYWFKMAPVSDLQKVPDSPPRLIIGFHYHCFRNHPAVRIGHQPRLA